MAEGGGLPNHIEHFATVRDYALPPHDTDTKPWFQGFCEYGVITHSFSLLELHSVARKNDRPFALSPDNFPGRNQAVWIAHNFVPMSSCEVVKNFP